MWNLKYGTNELIDKTETDSQTQKTDLWLQRGKGRKWDEQGVWQMQTITFRMDQQWGPTVQHRDLYSVFWDRP